MTHKLWDTFNKLETVGAELDALTQLLGFLVTSLSDEAVKVTDDPLKALSFMPRAGTFCTMMFAVCTGLQTQTAALTKNVDAGFEAVKEKA